MDPSDVADDAILEAGRSWLSAPGVTGLSVGPKLRDGNPSAERALVVHVVEKRPASDLTSGDLPIPPEVEAHVQTPDGRVTSVSIPTDVIGVGEDRLEVLNQRVRPCPGGYQISAQNIAGTGTLGVNIVWRGRYRALTCNHVISNNGNELATVYQPGAGGGNDFGTVDGFIPVVTYPTTTEPNPHYNPYDLAWSNTDPATGDPTVYKVAIPAGIRAPVAGEQVFVIGKQTAQVRSARIAYTMTMRGQVGWNGGYAWFSPVIQLDSVVTQPGDSGSAYIAQSDAKVVGIHVGANASFSWGCWLT